MNKLKALGLVLIVLSVVGCSSDPGVSGTVKIEGEPLAAGNIKFVPKSGGGSEFSTTVHGGAFEIKRDNIAGDYKVIVEVSFATAGGAEAFYADQERKGPARGSTVQTAEPEIHEFNETLTNGSNVLELEVGGEGESADGEGSS